MAASWRLRRPAQGRSASIVFSLSAPFAGPFESAYHYAVSATLPNAKILNTTGVSANRTPQGYEVLGERKTVLRTFGQPVFAQFAGVNIGGRLLLVALLANNEDAQRTYQPAIAEFIRGIELPGAQQGLIQRTAARQPTTGGATPNTVSGNVYTPTAGRCTSPAPAS